MLSVLVWVFLCALGATSSGLGPLKDFSYTVLGVNVTLRAESENEYGMNYVYQEFMEDFYKLRDAQIPDGAWMVDIGGNVGWFSVVAAKLFPQAHILAFEPFPANYAHLVHNLKVNGVSDRVKAFNLAVTADGRDVSLFRPSQNSGGTSEYARPSDRGQEPEQFATVKSTTITDILDSPKFLNNRPLTYVKVDCEGCEWEVIPRLPAERITYIVAELHRPSASGGPSAAQRAAVKAVLRKKYPGRSSPSFEYGTLDRVAPEEAH